ncbi:MAG: FHA domain-containing protein [Chloroflexi bacterium]|nr:FHA domain-containing protein [Chloroflexota bacterium]
MSAPDGIPPRLALRWEVEGQARLLPIPVDRAITLGRDPSCDLVFAHQTVSRHHASVFLREGRAFLRPQSRVSPTWLNGRLVLGDAPLRTGDRLQLAIVRVDVVAWQPTDETSDRTAEG